MATIKSIEEKAKAYDEAIEKLRRLHDDYDTVSTLIDIKEELENIFTELKESEGEKIRKELYESIRINNSREVADKYIAWIEKQGEQKTVIVPKFRVGDIIKNKKTKDEVKVTGVDLQNQSYYYQGWDGAATIHSDFRISEQDDYELVEHKPVWSEEDEIGLADARLAVEQADTLIDKLKEK